jgi:response regulator RpfG family c-di-GMP phosphodiesterase
MRDEQVARILHVEDEPEWIGFTRRALADHHVDSASSFDDALALIQDHPAYELALVDLDLTADGDRLGGEILDKLKADHPSTRRIVVTGRPPEGPLRANIFERYDVEEIIIKGKTTLPDLRKVVTEVLRNSSRDDIPQDVKVRRSELTQRYRDWHWRVDSIIRSKLRDQQEFIRNSGRLDKESERYALSELERRQAVQDRFRRESEELEALLSNVTNMPGADSAAERLDRVAEWVDYAIGP